MHSQKLPFAMRTKGGTVRPQVRTISEAIGLIDDDFPPEQRSQSRWTFAKELLLVAASSKKKRDVTIATRQLRHALSTDDLLADEENAA